MTASRCAAARSTRACHSSALHSWRLMRETWNCMANLLANVVSVSLAAAPRGIRQTRGKTAEPAYQRHRALCHVAAVQPRKELVTFQLIELHSVPRQLGPDCRLPKLAGSTAGGEMILQPCQPLVPNPLTARRSTTAAFWRLLTPSS